MHCRPRSVRPGQLKHAQTCTSNVHLLLQPETRPIVQEQLVTEVKQIYATILTVEAQCIKTDTKHILDAQGSLPNHGNDYWWAFIALHRSYLNELYDFLIASQHPSASRSLHQLASKYRIPHRLWRHGIHAPLEVLHRRLPHSLDHMLSFIHIVYPFLCLLYETVREFQGMWEEDMGHVARYRMTIEDHDIGSRATWAGVARLWYINAADRNPAVGRLYHHLGILARPDALAQLYYHTKSLTCTEPFLASRDALTTLFSPAYSQRSPQVYTFFIRAHAVLFQDGPAESLTHSLSEFLRLLHEHISKVALNWKREGMYIAMANVACLFNYGAKDSFLKNSFVEAGKVRQDKGIGLSRGTETNAAIFSSGIGEDSEQVLQPRHSGCATLGTGDVDLGKEIGPSHSSRVMFSTLALVLQRIGDPNVLPYIHMSFLFLLNLASVDRAIRSLESCIPWMDIVSFLNALIDSDDIGPKFQSEGFPHQKIAGERPLPEDYIMRGLEWAQGYFPEGWFEDQDQLYDGEPEVENAAMLRLERVLWLGIRISAHRRWLCFDSVNREFCVTKDVTTLQPTLWHQHIETQQISGPSKSVVVDTTIFLNALDTFVLMVYNEGWSVAIPGDVIAELIENQNNSTCYSGYAATALYTIEKAIVSTKLVFIEGTADVFKPAGRVLVTSDHKLRLKAQSHGFSAIMASAVRLAFARRCRSEQLATPR